MTFVNGTEQFRALGERIKQAVNTEFPREFRREVSRELNTAQGAVRRSALDVLPRRGGLAAVVAGSSLDVRDIDKGVRLSASLGHDISAMNRGRVRHPLFGNKAHWYSQSIKPGWWSIPIERSKPALREAANRALETTKQRAGG